MRISVPVPARAAPVVARALRAPARLGSLRRSLGFPWRAPTWPGTMPLPPVRHTLGPDYDTAWARSPAARAARAVLLEGVLAPAVKFVASPTVTGTDRLDRLEAPVVFAANHASHLDTPLLLTSLPERFRVKAGVVAAADYFFDRRIKAVVSALALAAIPIDRTAVSRRSLHRAEELLADGWNLVIFPEGGRTPDGWAHEFKAGAAFLATRANVPVVPVHIEGSRRVWRKGGGLHRSSTHVSFGSPLRPTGGLSGARELAEEIARSIAVLADEQASDWWTARRRAADGTTPPLSGPDAAAWRRAWALPDDRRRAVGPRWPA